MLVYRFKPQDRADQRVALTSDKTGKSLPSKGAPWQPIGEVDLAKSQPWIQAPVGDITAAVEKTGYFIWTIAVPPLKARFKAS